jgi:hypothetical protein
VTRGITRLSLVSLMHEDYHRAEGAIDRTTPVDLVFQNEYMVSRMLSFV